MHFNVPLRPYLQSMSFRVVEWSGAGGNSGLQLRRAYWEDTLGSNVTLIRLENSTEFKDW